jgi:hypothetical protein
MNSERIFLLRVALQSATNAISRAEDNFYCDGVRVNREYILAQLVLAGSLLGEVVAGLQLLEEAIET